MAFVTTKAFEDSYKSLNAAQRKAVDSIEGPVMVIAGPGTGKTTILTLRIANILRKTDIPADSILALTFTESGAAAMRRKLTSIIGAAAYKVNIHTFHGFAGHIFEQYPDYFPRIIGSSVITEVEQMKIIEEAIHSKDIKLLRPYGDQSYYVRPVLKEIQTLKRENISPARLKENLKVRNVKVGVEQLGGKTGGKKSGEMTAAEKAKLDKQFEKNIELARIYETYEKELVNRKKYDFEDMLLELIKVMETDLKLILQEQYQYILADEHQDANASQNKILELLADFHDSPNLFIVGDDKQAIYRFQGASLENFLYFSKKYKEAIVVDLTHNYRSHQSILDASHQIILNNPTIAGHAPKPLISLQMGSRPIQVKEYITLDDEIEGLAKDIKSLISNGAKPDSIVVLYRDNKNALPISSVFRAHGIFHHIESNRDLLVEPDVAKIILLMKVIANPSNDAILAQALFIPELKCDPAEIASMCATARRDELPLHKVVKSLPAYKKILEWSKESRVLQFPDFLQKIIQDTSLIDAVVKAQDSLERLEIIQSFYDHVQSLARSTKNFTIDSFIEYLNITEEHGMMANRAISEHLSGVRLMTAHRAKGLEFDYVFIVHAVDGVWGSRSSRNLFTIPLIEHARNIGRIEDERRLFYVAMTRAREVVTISYPLSTNDKENIPSQFIGEIKQNLINFRKVPSRETASHTAITFKSQEKNLGVSILEPGYIRSKFLTQPLSVTHLNNYLDCSWKYFFLNLIRIPQPQNKHQMYGTAIHYALRTFFNAHKDGRHLGKDQLIELFVHALESEPMNKKDRTESSKKGVLALGGYYDAYHNTWNKKLLTEYSIRGVELSMGPALNIQLTGKLDKVEFIDDRRVVVIDYKTGKPKSRNEIEGKTAGSDGNYKRQLVFYKLLLELNKSHSGFVMEQGEIDFIEPNDTGKYKKESFEISSAEVEDLKKVIAKMAEEILGLSFVNSSCNKKECEYCKLGQILLEHK